MKWFANHLRQMQETYLQHFICASKLGLTMVFAGVACMLHAIFPFLFQETGSRYLFQLLREYVERTPFVDNRMRDLSEVLNKKLSQW